MPINSGSVAIGSKGNIINGLNIGTVISIVLGNTQIKNFKSHGVVAKFDMPSLAIGQQVGDIRVSEATVTGTGGSIQVPCVIGPPVGYVIIPLSLNGGVVGTIFENLSTPPVDGDRIIISSLIDIDPDGTLVSNQYDVDRVYLVRSNGVIEAIDIVSGDGDGLYLFEYDILDTLGNNIANGTIVRMYLLNPTNNTYRTFDGSVQGGSVVYTVGGLVGGSYIVGLVAQTNPKISAPLHSITPVKIY